jgi:hypothetical protein
VILFRASLADEDAACPAQYTRSDYCLRLTQPDNWALLW